MGDQVTDPLTAVHRARKRGDVEYLLGALSDVDRRVRWLAIAGLGELGAREAIRPLLRLAESGGDEPTRNIAVNAVGKIKDPDVNERLHELAVDDPSYRIRLTSLAGLVNCGDRRAVTLLERILLTPDLAERENVQGRDARASRRWAAKKLAELGGTEAISTLERASRHGSFRERRAMRRALRALQSAP